MKVHSSPLVRLAMAIHSQLGTRGQRHQVALPTSTWCRNETLANKIRLAEFRGWTLAANRLRQDLGHILSSLQSQLKELECELAKNMSGSYFANAAEIYGDLLALELQFEAIEFDRENHWLAVTTEPITLEGKNLGPFKIQLDWCRLTMDAAYLVIAQDPHPAESREDVTHPHVADQRLCEGDGHLAIRRALTEGRLLDFFVLVANVLQTYNGESAFVEIKAWDGENCSDCGDAVSADCRSVCDKCDEAVCGECQTICSRCEASLCSQCFSNCAHCHDAHCGSCLKRCMDCQAYVCSKCLDINERCPNCVQEE